MTGLCCLSAQAGSELCTHLTACRSPGHVYSAPITIQEPPEKPSLPAPVTWSTEMHPGSSLPACCLYLETRWTGYPHHRALLSTHIGAGLSTRCLQPSSLKNKA